MIADICQTNICHARTKAALSEGVQPHVWQLFVVVVVFCLLFMMGEEEKESNATDYTRTIIGLPAKRH